MAVRLTAKICFSCLLEKPIEAFYRQHTNGRRHTCIPCTREACKAQRAKRSEEQKQKDAARQRRWERSNLERVKQSHKKSRDNDIPRFLHRLAKSRAKKNGIVFSLEISDIVVPLVCPYFGRPFDLNATKKNQKFAPSLDRIDPTKGYIKGNVQVISRLANSMKWDATRDELLTFAKAILNRLG